MIAGRAPAGTRQDSGRVSVKHDLIKTTVPGARQGLMLQSHCTFGPSRRLRSNPVAPVERILGGLRILRFFYLHRGVIPVGQVVLWLITVLSRVKKFRKTQVFTGCSRCPPGVPGWARSAPVWGRCIPGGPRCRCIKEPPRAHRHRRSVLFICLGRRL